MGIGTKTGHRSYGSYRSCDILAACAQPADKIFMLWIYQRGSENLRIETSFDTATQEYVLIKTLGPNETTVERFKEGDSYQLRLDALERELASERWNRVGDPIILRDGWKVG